MVRNDINFEIQQNFISKLKASLRNLFILSKIEQILYTRNGRKEANGLKELTSSLTKKVFKYFALKVVNIEQIYCT